MLLEIYYSQIILTVIHVSLFVITRWVMVRIVKRFAKNSERVEHRTGLIIKYIDFGTIFLLILGLILIWGVDVKNIGVVMSSVFAVIGVGFFAQWSILSNITSGVIMFFTFPYKIGDFIKIHDKDFPYEGVIDDIKTFHLILKTNNGEIITYPNSFMLQKGVSVIKVEDIAAYISEEDELDQNVKEQPID